MRKWKRLLLIWCAGLCTLPVQAQEKSDLMRDNGRIYVVVAVMLTILLGLILYIVRLDRRMGKMERDLDNKQ